MTGGLVWDGYRAERVVKECIVQGVPREGTRRIKRMKGMRGIKGMKGRPTYISTDSVQKHSTHFNLFSPLLGPLGDDCQRRDLASLFRNSSD